MKTLTFFWKYLTDARFRFWADFCTAKENIDRSIGLIEKNLQMQTHPLFFSEGSSITPHTEEKEN